MPIPPYPYSNCPKSPTMVEVLDADFSPIMVMEIEEAKRQKLVYKAVAVAVYNAEKKIFIVKKKEPQPGFLEGWTFSAEGFVRSSESLEAAAARILNESSGFDNLPLKLKAVLRPVTGVSSAVLHLFMAGPLKIRPTSGGDTEAMFLDHDELDGLKEAFPEMLSPWLTVALGEGHL